MRKIVNGETMEKGLLNSKNIISQDILHQVEALCTAGEPAACTASCPLHVDGRGLSRLAEQEDWGGAFKLYQKTVPFALILARTCSAPCMKTCLREKLGGAIRLQKLEEAIAETAGKPGKAPPFLARKKQRAAVIGGGISGLTAAHDLAKKGYQVTLFEKNDQLGGSLLELPEDVLPKEILSSELQILNKLKVKIELESEIALEKPEMLAPLLDDFDGIYISCTSPFDTMTDSTTQQLHGYEMILAGQRQGKLRFDDSIVYQMFDGRSAAATLDRLFQKVNIQAGREKEGGYVTTLYTELKGIEVLSPPHADASFSKEEAAAEASRCIQCRCDECVKKCGFLQHYKGNPGKYVREVYNNLSIAMGTHHANPMINTCALCSQCEAICPNGLDMKQVFQAARERMAETKKMPQSAFEFGLLDMDFSMSDQFFLAKHQEGFESSSVLFFPGCQLPASEPELVKTVYQDLCQRLEGGVGLMLSCCGVLAKWAGDKAGFQQVKDKVIAEWTALGKPAIITACPTCTQVLQEALDIKVESLFEVLERMGKSVPEMQEMRLHHACGARYDKKMKKSVMKLTGMADLAEEHLSETSPCCGYGGLVPVSDREIADKITETAVEQLRISDSAMPILTYCVNCRDRFLAKNQASYHVLELIYPQAEGLNHTSPTWSRRQDNRTDLKMEMLKDFWGEEMEKEERMKLIIDDKLEQKLEELHILHQDIAGVIAHAEDSGEKLMDPDTGHFTAYQKRKNVTFWVEYAPAETGWSVYNAYSHRMTFILTDKITEGRGGEDD